MRILRTGRGFTLVEMLVVLAIIGVLMGVSYPFYSSIAPRIQIASASRELMDDLRAARREAMHEKKTNPVYFRPSQGEYEWNGHTRRLTVAVSLDGKSENPVVRFYKDGSGDPAVITLSGGKNRAVIRVDWLTGKARLVDG